MDRLLRTASGLVLMSKSRSPELPTIRSSSCYVGDGVLCSDIECSQLVLLSTSRLFLVLRCLFSFRCMPAIDPSSEHELGLTTMFSLTGTRFSLCLRKGLLYQNSRPSPLEGEPARGLENLCRFFVKGPHG